MRRRLLRKMAQDPDYDTFDDLDTSTLTTLSDLYEAILGPALRQPGVFGILITGIRDMTSTQNAAMSWGTDSVEFEKYPENWQVRSHPKGRMGTLLKPDEVRKVAVLVRSSASNGKAARISVIKLWLVPPKNIFAVSNERHRGTYGAHGVNTIGIHLFEHHGRAQERGIIMGRNQYRAVLGSYVTATTQPPPHLETTTADSTAQFFIDGKMMVDSVQACPLHVCTIAASLAACELQPSMSSTDIPDTRQLDVKILDEKRFVVNCGVSELLLRKEHARRAYERAASSVFEDDESFSDDDEECTLRLAPEHLKDLQSEAAALVASAEMLCENLSHGGFLDMMADSFFDGAMPDSMHRPSGMPLLVAFAVRIACYPDRVGIPVGTPDDQFAAREAANLFESFQSAVLPHGIGDFKGTRSEPQFAIDIVIQHSVEKMLKELDRIKNATPSSASAALKEKLKQQGTQVDAIERKVREALVFFHRAGTAVIVDLCGFAPRRADGTTGVYNNLGLAESCCDPVDQSKNAEAYKNNLGYLTPRVDPMRCTTVGARQMALARVLALVERWLCTGTYCGTLLTVPESPGPELVHLSVVHDAATKTLSRCFSPSEEEPKPSNGSFETLKPLFEQALESTATIVKAGGSKKKMRRAQLRSAASIKDASKYHVQKLLEDEVAQMSMTAKSRRRGAANSRIVGEAIDSLTKCQKTGTSFVDAVQGLERGSGQAIDDATCIFGAALSCGAVLGATQVIDFQTFLVGNGSENRCCNCEKIVNVVESIAFGGHAACCQRCKHPRCLDCVQFDIDVLGGELDGEGAGPPYRVLENCLFCK